jgi:hypothetical protein
VTSRFALLLATALAAGLALAQPRQPDVEPAAPAAPMSSAAERVYELARPRILQIRTLLQAAGRQTTIGSGFLVTADGFAITNYHVVSQFALDPRTYRLEYLAPDGARGPLQLLAIDVPHDLAVVKIDRADLPYFTFDTRALGGRLPKGERIYAMGNPLDLGFTIVEGHLQRPRGQELRRAHPLLGRHQSRHERRSRGGQRRARGRESTSRRASAGNPVGFLVPAKFAATLIERARKGPPLAIDKAREEVGRQLDQWQAGFFDALRTLGFRNTLLGPYRGLESAAPWMSCWANTNADQVQKPRASMSGTRCSSATGIFVSDRILTGRSTSPTRISSRRT